MLTALTQDLKFAFRMLRRGPRVGLAISVILAVAIGANTIIFAIVNGMLLRDLPFQQPNRVVFVGEQNIHDGNRRNPSLTSALEWKERSVSFSQVEFAVNYVESANLTLGTNVERVKVQYMSPALPQMLGIRLAAGRGFAQQRSEGGAFGSEVLVSSSLWQRRFGGAPDVIGRNLDLSVGVFTVAGVLAPNSWVVPWARDADVWIALNPKKLNPETRWLGIMARLRPDVSASSAASEIKVFTKQLSQQHPGTNREWTASVLPLREEWFGGDVKQLLFLLMGAVGIVLLIACANAANLLLARSASRAPEIAIRLAIGATRPSLIRQLLIESALIGAIAGAMGLLVAVVGLNLLTKLIPELIALADQIFIDVRVLAFTIILSILTAILFGTIPALSLSATDLNSVLKARVRGKGPRRFGANVLVVCQIGLSFVLLSGAGLMAVSLHRLQHVELGFTSSHLLTVEIGLDGDRYRKVLRGDIQRISPGVDAFFENVLEAVRKCPGVVAASLQGTTRTCPVRIAGKASGSADEPTATVAEIDAAYLRTMGIDLLRGRDLTQRDDQLSPWVALVNAAFVKRYFSGLNAVGQQITLEFTDTGGRRMREAQSRTIVGVTADVKVFGAGKMAPPMVYMPHQQHMQDYPGGASSTHLSKMLVLRTAGEPGTLKPLIKKIASEVDPTQVIPDPETMAEVMADSLSVWRFSAQLFGALSLLALLLAQTGVYALISYLVTLRRREIALRIAVGASRTSILGFIFRYGLRLMIPGIALGVLAAVALTRLASSFLYGVAATDALTFFCTALVLLAVGLAGCIVPARRALQTDPNLALRAER